jgi:hypothetical protein
MKWYNAVRSCSLVDTRAQPMMCAVMGSVRDMPQPDGQNAPPRFVTHSCVADMQSIGTSLRQACEQFEQFRPR